MESFINQNAEGLAAEESFQNWYFKRNEGAVEFWDRWIHNNPEKTAEVEKAKAILDKLDFKVTQVDLGQVNDSWNKINEIIKGEKKNFKVIAINQGEKSFKRRVLVRRIVAAVGLLITCALVAYYNFEEKSNYYQTKFGETISVTLPDNSVVTLNSNSSLRYHTVWGENDDREVWLVGEAYFSVVNTPTNLKFNVITNGLTVEVLGTEFNVNNRKGRTRVVLKSGKVKLNIDKPQIKEELLMKPGELIEFMDTSKTVIKKIVNPEVFTSWRCKKLVFENTPLEEIVLLLEESYGLTVEVAEDGLLEKQVSGSVPSNNTKLLMDGLSEVFDLDIVWTKNHVKIKSKVINTQ